jgi:hypothetical protein
VTRFHKYPDVKIMGWSSYDCCIETNGRLHHEIQVEHKIELMPCLAKGKTDNVYAAPCLYYSAVRWPPFSALVVTFILSVLFLINSKMNGFCIFVTIFSDVFDPVEEGAVRLGNNIGGLLTTSVSGKLQL